ncbi:MAG: biopolymer transporter ExbD [Candidatus Goldbacteria bacterium]|nr:biopolymer transporter ExbD [Candidatus Goldiibacteriota bacterium]
MLKKREKEKLIFEINITPLTDVILVLLIIFMVTTPFIIQGNIKINLPSAKAPSEISLNNKNIIVAITSDGSMFLNGNSVKDEQELLQGIKNEINKTGNTTVIIEGDKMAFHGEMVRVMSIAKEAGAEKLAITTIPDEDKKGNK